MNCPNTRSRCTMLSALLLVWLTGLGEIGAACAEAADARKTRRQAEDGYTLAFATFKAADSYQGLDPDTRVEDTALGLVDNASRADLFTLARVVVEEMEFLAGIRILWDQAEKKFDKVALKLKLKGDISLEDGDPPAARRGGRPESSREQLRSMRLAHSGPRLSLSALLIPDKIQWHFGIDPSENVLFGELKWGHFITLQSDVGSYQKVKMVFRYDF